MWSSQIADGSVNLAEVKFSLITTVTSAPGTIAYLLRINRNSSEEDVALGLLREIARTTTNEANKAAYKSFSDLTPSQQEGLVRRITILDNSANILDARELISSQLQYVTKAQFLSDLVERVEGWWFGRVVRHLSEKNRQPILHRELSGQINDLQEQYHSDSLPINFADLIGPEEGEIGVGERIFIEQLRLVMVGEPRIRKAITDYFRAYHQRSKWLREGHLLIGDLGDYETRLIDEWERLFEATREDLDESSSEEQKKKAGKALFSSVDRQATLHIRPRCTEPYVMRGSYHRLSNELRVGWHPDFRQRLKRTIVKAMKADK